MNLNRTDTQIFHRARRDLLALLLYFAVLSAFSGCGTQGSVKSMNTAATATAEAQATQAAEPVVVTADVRQEGTVAGKNVTLVADVTVHNQSSEPIYLARFTCSPPIIHVGLYDASSLLWHNWGRGTCLKGPGCPPNDGDGVADQMVAPGVTYPWSMRNDLCTNNPTPTVALQAGKSYTVQIMVYWLSQACSPQATPTTPVPLHTTTATKAITLR